jgi:sortase A
MNESRSKLSRLLRAAEYALALAGSACLLAYAGACARTSYTQQRESAAFEAALSAQAQQRLQERMQRLHAESPNRRDWSPARLAKYQATLGTPVHALARLEIPDVDLSVMVLEGSDDTTLDRAVGHIEGTARPGEPGNLGIAGHRDGYFRALRHVEKGDQLTLTTLDGVAHYEVEKISVVDPARIDVLAPTKVATLTLVTCYPFYHLGDAPWRYVVTAKRVSYETWASLDARSAFAVR